LLHALPVAGTALVASALNLAEVVASSTDKDWSAQLAVLRPDVKIL
jgi:hypothetical protein